MFPCLLVENCRSSVATPVSRLDRILAMHDCCFLLLKMQNQIAGAPFR
jgi:hypothetical protein